VVFAEDCQRNSRNFATGLQIGILPLARVSSVLAVHDEADNLEYCKTSKTFARWLPKYTKKCNFLLFFEEHFQP
jgi:hypothetical protein